MSNGVTDIHRRPHYKAARPASLLGNTLEYKSCLHKMLTPARFLNIIDITYIHALDYIMLKVYIFERI